MAPPVRDLEERFWEKVDASGDCWVWIGARKNGYGSFSLSHSGPVLYAHRFAYETLVGVIPVGLELDHLCRNPPCINPDHLEPVTSAVNMSRSPTWYAQRTHCKRGHPFDKANSMPVRGGKRCRTCHRDHQREYDRLARAA